MQSKAAKFSVVLVLLIVALLFLFPPSTSAVGVGVTPSELNFEFHSGGSAAKALYVVNTGDSEAGYKVYVDEEYEGWFDITPKEFSLAPQGSKEVQITVSSPPIAFGNHETYIYVVAANSPSRLEVTTGIKVPVHIVVSNPFLWIGIGVVAALLVAFIAFFVRRRRRMFVVAPFMGQ